MKSESTVKFVLRLTLTLLIITSVVAALLAVVNGITAPVIAAANEEKIQQAIEMVLPGGGEPMDVPEGFPLVSAAYASETGYALQVTPSGFGDTITMMVGVDKDGNVLKISIISHSETAGLGAVAAASTSAGESFRSQFVGMSGNVSVAKDGGEVEAITGATITSRAICEGVNAALEFVASLG